MEKGTKLSKQAVRSWLLARRRNGGPLPERADILEEVRQLSTGLNGEARSADCRDEKGKKIV
jgi:hypothetical protein